MSVFDMRSVGKVTNITTSDIWEICSGLHLIRDAFDTGHLHELITAIASHAVFRHMETPTGPMSVATTNCGQFGWIADRAGYRYSSVDPMTGLPWPAMPSSLEQLCRKLADMTGNSQFSPDACLINRYEIGTKMGLHQDRDETDRTQPIISLSAGLTGNFAIKTSGTRLGPSLKVALRDCDALVISGPMRLAYHGITKIVAGNHPIWGTQRVNLTIRQAR